MTFSVEWDKAYKDNLHMSIWPWSDLISYVIRYVRPAKKHPRVLELGCGAGANIPFFMSQGYNYYGIDGSSTIISKLQKKFPKLKKNLLVADFTIKIPFDEKFDLVIDRSSVTHNTTEGIKRCLDLVYEKMKDDAKYIGIDWFSTAHQDYSLKTKKIDKHAKSAYTKGQFANVGTVYFSNKSHLMNLFEKFEIVVLEHKVVISEIPEKRKFAVWNFVARKR
jgi:SAM-dependent methyltransferase